MTYDLQILRGTTRVKVAYSDPAMALAGSAKLATRFASLFLTDNDPILNRGTDFVPALRRGLRTDAAIQLAFTLAAFDVMTQLGNQSGLPASERLARAELLGHTIFSDHLTLNVRLHTLDGVTVFTMPLERLP